MIYIIFFLMFNPVSVFANFYPEKKPGAKTVYAEKWKCEQVEGKECFETGVFGKKGYKDPRFHETKTKEVNDQSKPIYKPKYNLKNCSSPEDCQSKIAKEGKSYCQNGDYANFSKNVVMPGFSYFCTGVSGYEKKTVKEIVVNQGKKVQIETAESERKEIEKQLLQQGKNVAFGTKLIGIISMRNKSKSITRAQRRKLFKDFRGVVDFLYAGAIDDAKAEIEEITPDGTVVTQADKDAILAEINSYLGQ